MGTPRHEETRPVHVAKQNTERADPPHSKEKGNTMSTPKSTLTATAPQGFTPEPDSRVDEVRITLWRDKINNVIDIFSIGTYRGPGKGHCYTLDPVERNRGYAFAELKVAHEELARFNGRAEQIEGGTR